VLSHVTPSDRRTSPARPRQTEPGTVGGPFGSGGSSALAYSAISIGAHTEGTTVRSCVLTALVVTDGGR
jgi:hypothetical protein